MLLPLAGYLLFLNQTQKCALILEVIVFHKKLAFLNWMEIE
jgi:hypothetical protein